MTAADRLSFIWHRTVRIFVGDMAFLRLVMALSSFAVVAILWAPGSTLDGEGFEIFGRFLNDGVYSIPYIVHALGMLRQSYALTARPRLDVWMNLLGAWLFVTLGLEIMVCLHKPTLQGSLWIIVGLFALWGAVRSGNGIDGGHP